MPASMAAGFHLQEGLVELPRLLPPAHRASLGHAAFGRQEVLDGSISAPKPDALQRPRLKLEAQFFRDPVQQLLRQLVHLEDELLARGPLECCAAVVPFLELRQYPAGMPHMPEHHGVL